jgi:hypothetical protein
MKTIPKTRASNVTPFVLDGCWALDGIDHYDPWLKHRPNRARIVFDWQTANLDAATIVIDDSCTHLSVPLTLRACITGPAGR